MLRVMFLVLKIDSCLEVVATAGVDCNASSITAFAVLVYMFTEIIEAGL